MSMQYIRDYYGVPAKRGGRVRYSGFKKPVEGTITSADGSTLRVRFDGESESMLCHPTWKLEYLGVEAWDKA